MECILARIKKNTHFGGSMIHWIRQVESLTERYDYTLLLECAENYVCEVSKAILCIILIWANLTDLFL